MMLNSCLLIAGVELFEILKVWHLLHRHPPFSESSKQLILSRRLACAEVASSGSAGACRSIIFSYNDNPKPR
jgi:hypothetical protein